MAWQQRRVGGSCRDNHGEAVSLSLRARARHSENKKLKAKLAFYHRQDDLGSQ